MDVNHVKRLIEIANGELPKVEEICKNLHRDVMNLNQKKRDAEAAILKLNGDIIYLRNTAEHQRLRVRKTRIRKKEAISKKDKVRVSNKRTAE